MFAAHHPLEPEVLEPGSFWTLFESRQVFVGSGFMLFVVLQYVAVCRMCVYIYMSTYIYIYIECDLHVCIYIHRYYVYIHVHAHNMRI